MNQTLLSFEQATVDAALASVAAILQVKMVADRQVQKTRAARIAKEESAKLSRRLAREAAYRAKHPPGHAQCGINWYPAGSGWTHCHKCGQGPHLHHRPKCKTASLSRSPAMNSELRIQPPPMKILAARKYKSPRSGPLSQAEAETRRLAYAIKDPRSPSADFDTAAREMAALIEDQVVATPLGVWLVPIPSSDGSIRANTILASHIAHHVGKRGSHPGAQIAAAIRRSRPIESQCSRHRRNLPATSPADHHLKPALPSLCHRQIYFVDNVATSGNTMRAAHAALQRGAGLVFADAGHNTTTRHDPTLL